ncbi:MAG: aldehyde ferredoxin oxidoreductase family protein [Pirellulaceae bacterium]
MSVPGTTGNVLIVDLTAGQTRREHPEDETYLKYFGGYGLGVEFLYRMQRPGADPLGPDNILGFFCGLLTGTGGITSNRFAVVARSPKSGGWGDANSGGSFGPVMKSAGLDGIVFTGVSDRPVYLLWRDGKADLCSAEDLWGLDTHDTEDRLAEKHGANARVACIGPAGEHQSLLACIINEKYRAAGRSGLGAVMGSKKLKAVVVVGSGKIDIPIADPEAYKQSIAEHREYLKTTTRWEGLRAYGTSGSVATLTNLGDTPVKNWAGVGHVDFPNVSKISDDAVIALERKKYACWRCPLSCGGMTEVKDGPFASSGHKPEYETLGAFGAMCLNDDLASINLCNDLCNRYGMDTISTGSTVAFAMECYDRGLIGRKETHGLDLRWGNAEAIVEATRQIALREGIGELLADGTQRAAERIGNGAHEFAIHVGGEELPMHDPRLVPSAATSYKMDATPGRHTQISTWIAELSSGPPGLIEQPLSRKYEARKGEMHVRINNYFQVAQCAGLCMFATLALKPTILPESLSLVTGHPFSLDDVLVAGARIATLRMAFNLREGVRNVDFEFPGRAIGNPPLKEGPTADTTVNLDAQVCDYLQAMGWDQQSGVPTPETLTKLDLDFVIDDLHTAR